MMKEFFKDLLSNKKVVVRIILFVFAWLNSFLVERGLQPLPVLDEASVSSFLTFAVSIWTLAADNTIRSKNK